MDRSKIDFTGTRYGFMPEPKWKDIDGEERNLACLLHILELEKIPATPIYKGTPEELPGKKIVFLDVGTEKKGKGTRIYYTFGNKILQPGFSVQPLNTTFKDMVVKGISFEECLLAICSLNNIEVK